jgi:hypothetical protein
MKKYRLRYNKTRGQQNRGTLDHAWRLFEDDKEYIVKNVIINVPSFTEREGEDWNICCYGVLEIDRSTSTATINK